MGREQGSFATVSRAASFWEAEHRRSTLATLVTRVSMLVERRDDPARLPTVILTPIAHSLLSLRVYKHSLSLYHRQIDGDSSNYKYLKSTRRAESSMTTRNAFHKFIPKLERSISMIWMGSRGRERTIAPQWRFLPISCSTLFTPCRSKTIRRKKSLVLNREDL